jgi:hypothetical protein
MSLLDESGRVDARVIPELEGGVELGEPNIEDIRSMTAMSPVYETRREDVMGSIQNETHAFGKYKPVITERRKTVTRKKRCLVFSLFGLRNIRRARIEQEIDVRCALRCVRREHLQALVPEG